MSRENARVVEAFCSSCREAVLSEIGFIVKRHGWGQPELNELVLDYPLRSAKGLRPAIAIAVARSLGVTDQGILPTASVVELLHNAFLIHDDVEDQSLFRRGERTLQHVHGAPIAINVADGMFAIAVAALLDNTDLLGLRLALEMLGAVSKMFHVTVEGQAIELAWIRDNICRFESGDHRAAYEDMVRRKTAMYSFVIPVEIGCISAAAPSDLRASMETYAEHLGIAFQIADDLLNLREDVSAYGKETAGDLWEGKRTLMVLHALQEERDPATFERARAILARERPPLVEPDTPSRAALIDELFRDGHVDATARTRLLAALTHGSRPQKNDDDVAFLKSFIDQHDGVAYATKVALDHVHQATHAFQLASKELAAGPAHDFLAALPRYVLDRLR